MNTPSPRSEQCLDMLVVGAGPAGVAAGLHAKARGLDVLVVDKATFPRDKTCGDGLTAGALRCLERLGVDTPAIAGYTVVDETVLVSPTRRRVSLPLPDRGHYSAVVPRLALDAALVARARDAGVEICDGVGLDTLVEHNDRVVAGLTDGRPVQARFVVAADGHYSNVRRAQQLSRERDREPDLGTWHAFRQYFSGVQDRRQWVFFERDLLPGYAWVFPLPDGRANVGFGVLRDAGFTGKDLKQLWPELLARPSILAVLGHEARPEGTHRAWPIPASYNRQRLARRRAIYAGDAAGVVDPMTGEGIGQALESGMLAAAAIAGGGDASVVGARYQRTVDKAIGRDLRFAATLQRVLRTPVGVRAVVAAADMTAWTRRNVARWMFEDYPRALVLTPDRWRPGALSAPGAYQ